MFKMFREDHLLSTMVGGSFMFGGVLFILIGIPNTFQIGYTLLMLTPIPSVIYWMVKKDNSSTDNIQRESTK